MTARQLLGEAEAALAAGPHPERARLDAEALLLHVLRRDRAWLRLYGYEAVTEHEVASFQALVERRLRGEPVQYITGEAEFFGLPFRVAPGVLIPRPETEHLVEEVLRLVAGVEAPHIADIGTGSGAIAVALAHALPAAEIAAVDLSCEALAIARQNAERNGVAGQIGFYEGDLLEPLTGQSFNMIASNPPYVPLVDRDSLSVEVRGFEPHGALFAGDDGLDVYRRLIPEAQTMLEPGGWLVMEIGYGQRDAVESLLMNSGYVEVRFIADYQGIARVAVGRLRID